MLFNDKATDQKKPRPNCDMCNKDTDKAAVDGKTQMGPWAYMCVYHHEDVGLGLGMGIGQVLLCGDELDELLKTHYHLEAA